MIRCEKKGESSSQACHPLGTGNSMQWLADRVTKVEASTGDTNLARGTHTQHA